MSIIDGPKDENSIVKFLHKKAAEEPLTFYWKNSAGKSVLVHLFPFISRREIGLEIEGADSFIAYPEDLAKILRKFGFKVIDMNEPVY